MAAAGAPSRSSASIIRASRHAAFAIHGARAGYADWRSPQHPDPDVAVAIDGHLDNRRPLEYQLFGRPQPWSSAADVLLRAYRHWGARMVERIDGVHAIVIWDNHIRQLVLVRDAMGGKALFYAPQPDGAMLFATRATALLAHPAVVPVVDADGLNELITMAPVRSPGHAVLRGVYEVEPGHLVRMTPNGIRSQPHWGLHADAHDDDLDGTVAVVRRILEDNIATRREQPPEVVLLSGGVPSAAIAALTASPSPGDDRTAALTLTVAGPHNPPSGAGADLQEAASVAAHLDLRHTVTAAGTDDLLDAATATSSILDFPGQSNLDSTLLTLLRRAAEHGPTAASGDGADAVFGGYRWQHDTDTADRDDFPWQQRSIAPVDLLNPDAHAYLMPGSYRRHRYDTATANVAYLTGEDTRQRRRRRDAHLTITHYLPHLLTRLDHLSAAAGISVRAPFADWMLAQYAWNIPYAMRHLVGISNGLLRHTIAGDLPPEVAWQPSRPFPGAHLLPGWQRSQRERLHDITRDPAAPLHALLDRRRTRHLVERPVTHPSGEWHTTVAYLIELNAWLDRHRIAIA